LELANFQFRSNMDTLNHLGVGFYKVASLSAYEPTLKQNPGIDPSVGFSLFPNFSTRGFAFGVLMQSQLAAESDGKGHVEYRSEYLFIPTLGTGIRLASGIIRIGYSLQWVNQASGQVTVADPSVPMGYNQQLQDGKALSHTVGFAMTLPYTYLPALNLVARNVGGARFSGSPIIPLARNPSGTLPTEDMSVDASLSMMVKLGGGTTATYVLEDRDATDTSHLSLGKRAAAGIEFGFHERFYLRGGWGEGYPDAGIGFRSKRSDFSLSWFSQAVGTPSQYVKDTQLLMQYQVRAF